VANLLKRLRSWLDKDALEAAEEGTRLTEAERDIAHEDYEARKDDLYAAEDRLGGGLADYESDSKAPGDPAP
jgi:hypothetical protein